MADCVPWCSPAPAAVYFKDNRGNLQQLEEPKATRVLQAAAKGERYVALVVGDSWRRSPSCDLQRMKHINSKTGEEEDIIIEVSWNAPVMKAVVDGGGALRRQVLVMALHRIRHAAVLQKILAHKGLRLSSDRIRENPYICSGHLPFENFLDSVLTVKTFGDILYGEHVDPCLAFLPTLQDKDNLWADIHVSTNLAGHIIETASASDESQSVGEHYRALEDAGFLVVYHGTSHGVMDAILEQGLRPECRSPSLSTDYFGVTHDVSRRYTIRRNSDREQVVEGPVVGCKVLVFFILGGLSVYSGAVTVSSNKDQLPIAEVTLSY